MPVDPTLPRKVLVVHGVQAADDHSLHRDRLIARLIRDRLGDLPLSYDCDLYRYESPNDQSLQKYKPLLNLIVPKPVGQILGDAVPDLGGDMVNSPVPGSTTDSAIGLPIRLDVFRITGRDRLTNLGPGQQRFHWRNIRNRHDPVVSGNAIVLPRLPRRGSARFMSDRLSADAGGRLWSAAAQRSRRPDCYLCLSGGREDEYLVFSWKNLAAPPVPQCREP